MQVEDIFERKTKLQDYKVTGIKSCKTILKELESAELTAEQIKQTKISQTVNTLSNVKFEDPNEDEKEFLETAQKLIKTWKAMFQNKKKSQNSLTNIPQLKKTASSTSQTQINSQPQITPLVKGIIPQNLNYKILPEYSRTYRKQAAKRLFEVLLAQDPKKEVIEQDDLDFLDQNDTSEENQQFAKDYMRSVESLVLKKIEKEAFANRQMSTVERNYKACMLEICSTILKRSDIRKQIFEKQITDEQIANQDPDVFLTEEEKRKNQELKEKEKKMNDPHFWANKQKDFMKNFTEGETCRFCRKKCAYCKMEKQTRSADEPMTRFMRCDDCDRDWRD